MVNKESFNQKGHIQVQPSHVTTAPACPRAHPIPNSTPTQHNSTQLHSTQLNKTQHNPSYSHSHSHSHARTWRVSRQMQAICSSEIWLDSRMSVSAPPSRYSIATCHIGGMGRKGGGLSVRGYQHAETAEKRTENQEMCRPGPGRDASQTYRDKTAQEQPAVDTTTTTIKVTTTTTMEAIKPIVRKRKKNK